MSATATTQPASGNFVARLWRGDVSLAKTYWIFGVLVGVALRLLSPAVTYEVMSHARLMSAFDIRALLYGWAAIVIIYSVFILIAIWRSANKYRVLNPASKGNATLAQIACVLGAVSIIISLVGTFSTDENILASGGGESPDSRMQHDAMVAGLNADLPKKIDSITTLTKIDVDESGFKLFETVSASAKINKATFAQNARRILSTGLCKDQDVRNNLNRNLNYDYVYVDSNQNSIGQVLITKADCPASG
jgi:hypothetical protein